MSDPHNPSGIKLIPDGLWVEVCQNLRISAERSETRDRAENAFGDAPFYFYLQPHLLPTDTEP